MYRATQILIYYYSLFLLTISVWSLYDKTNDKEISFLTIVASLFIFGTTITIDSLNLKERIIKIKECYIQLDKLLSELEILSNEISSEDQSIIKIKFIKIRNSYLDILSKVENHNTYDFLKFKISNKEEKVKFKKYIHYILLKCFYYSVFLVLFILPFILILIFKGMNWFGNL